MQRSLNANESALVDKLQYLLVSLLIIVSLLITVIGALFLVRISMANEAIATAASFLTILTLLLYFFFEECKKLALAKPTMKQDTTNLHDIKAEAMKPLTPLVALHVRAPSMVHDKSTILIPK